MARTYVKKEKCLEERDSYGNTDLIRTILKLTGDCKNAAQVKVEASIQDNNEIKEAIQVLINRDDNINIKNYKGDTALSISLNEGREDLAELLIQFGADCNIIGTSKIPPLVAAVKMCTPSLVMSMVKAGARVNTKDDCGNTALTTLLKRGHNKVWNEEQLLKCIEVLTEQGADVNLTTKDNMYPLLIAVQKKMPTVVRHLVQVGADVNLLDDRNDPILITSVETLSNEIVSCLINGGACVNSVDKMGLTALIRALKLRHPCTGRSNVRHANINEKDIESYFRPRNDIVKTLVDKGACLNVLDEDKNSPLHLGIRIKDEELVKMLIECGANVNTLDDNNCKDMLNSITNSNCKLASKFTTHGRCECEINPTPLHLSLRMEWEPGFQILLTAGADITVKDMHRNSIVHYAARCSSAYFLNHLLATHSTSKSDQENQCHISKQRLGQDEVNCRNISNATALHIAAANNRADNVVTLIKAGCDLNTQTQGGMTPLLIALASGFDNVAQILLEYGADINLKSENGESAFYLACKNNCHEAFDCLLKSGVNIHEINNAGQAVVKYSQNIAISQKLINLGLDIHQRNDSGLTFLHTAAMAGNTELARLILSQGEDVNVVTNFGDTPLILAAAANRKEVIQVLYDFDADANKQNNDGTTALIAYCKMLKIGFNNINGTLLELLRFNPVLDIQDNSGCTALMYLAQKDLGVFSEIEMLLEKGSKVNIKNKGGKTALVYSMASCFGDRPTCKTLLEYGADPVMGELAKNISFDIHKQAVFFLNDSEILRLCLCNGFVFSIESKLKTPIPVEHMLQHRQMSRIRYLLANCCLGTRDLKVLRSFDSSKFTNNEVTHDAFGYGHIETSQESLDEDLLMRFRCEPWPLVKLAFIAVSTLLGDTPDRQRRLENTSLPVKLQEMLMFQTPLARLPVKEWPNIQLCFDPIEYERLPKPRPLLYYWPVGKAYY